jgi:hypothetical protein
MDPYLETPDLWPVFERTFIACLHEALQSGLGDRYQARIQERPFSGQGEHRAERLEIVRHGDEQLVTLLEVVSLSNKTTAAGREAYLCIRQQARIAKANFVEIDLVLQGEPLLEFSREGLPAWDYAVTVARASQPERFEIYTATLQKRLPRFRVPLSGTDRDTVLDLQALFGRCYDQADFGSRIDYGRPPAFLHDRIASAAYHLWQQEGCPHGRDREHWYMAVEQLRRPRK